MFRKVWRVFDSDIVNEFFICKQDKVFSLSLILPNNVTLTKQRFLLSSSKWHSCLIPLSDNGKLQSTVIGRKNSIIHECRRHVHLLPKYVSYLSWFELNQEKKAQRDINCLRSQCIVGSLKVIDNTWVVPDNAFLWSEFSR